ncbi:MAG: hypothetical protein P8X42_14695, partial [Calditrichaceae bacterium]
MNSTQFRVQFRINEYFQQIKSVNFLDTRLIVHALAWWVTFFLTITFFEWDSGLAYLWLFIYYYFWFSFNKEIIKKFIP